MSYLSIFIISLLLTLSPYLEDDSETVSITFESASLVHYQTVQSDWQFSAAINNAEIGQNGTLKINGRTLDKVTFYVSSKNSKENFATTDFNKTMVSIEEMSIERASGINTYGSNPVTLDVQELLKYGPSELNIHASVTKQNDNKLVPTSREVVFNFKLHYN